MRGWWLSLWWASCTSVVSRCVAQSWWQNRAGHIWPCRWPLGNRTVVLGQVPKAQRWPCAVPGAFPGSLARVTLGSGINLLSCLCLLQNGHASNPAQLRPPPWPCLGVMLWDSMGCTPGHGWGFSLCAGGRGDCAGIANPTACWGHPGEQDHPFSSLAVLGKVLVSG